MKLISPLSQKSIPILVPDIHPGYANDKQKRCQRASERRQANSTTLPEVFEATDAQRSLMRHAFSYRKFDVSLFTSHHSGATHPLPFLITLVFHIAPRIPIEQQWNERKKVATKTPFTFSFRTRCLACCLPFGRLVSTPLTVIG